MDAKALVGEVDTLAHGGCAVLIVPVMAKALVGLPIGFGRTLRRNLGIAARDVVDKQLDARIGLGGQTEAAALGFVRVVYGDRVPEIKGHGLNHNRWMIAQRKAGTNLWPPPLPHKMAAHRSRPQRRATTCAENNLRYVTT